MLWLGVIQRWRCFFGDVLFNSFCPLWSCLVHFGFIQSILSTLFLSGSYLSYSTHSVKFGPNRSILSTLVLFSPFGLIWSTLVLLGPIWCTTVHLVQLSPFGPIQPICVHFSPFSFFRSILVYFGLFLCIYIMWNDRFWLRSPILN